MKKFITILFISFSINFYSQWVLQETTEQALNDVYCVTEDLVFVVGNAGTILKTIDGGINWNQKTAGTSQALIKVQFANENVGCVISATGTLLRTINGGENWSSISNMVISNVTELSYINENIFYCISNGILVKTTNGGTSFQVINTTETLNKIQFINEQIGFTSNLKTLDGGVTWSFANSYNVSSFFYLNQNIGFIYTTENGKYKTIDGGITYTTVTEPNQMEYAIDIFAVNQNVIWELNYSYPLVLNIPPDYCITKNIVAEQVSQNDNFCTSETPSVFGVSFINSLNFANETTGFVVGGWTGSFFGPTNGGRIFKISTENMAVNKVNFKERFKVYPNPATSQITISLAGIPSQFFNIDIHNSFGKKVYSQSYQAINDINIDTKAFSSGIYYVSVISQEKRKTLKVIIN